MATYYVNSNNCAPWQAAHVYSVGDRCVAKIANTDPQKQFNVYECTTGGTSHATTEPTWNETVTGTTNDNDVVWTTRRPSTWDNAHHSVVMMASLPSAILAAGDIILVHKTHAENIGSDYSSSLFYYGTAESPIIVCCVDKDNSDAIDSGATITLGKTKAIRGSTIVINVALLTGYNLTYTNMTGGIFLGIIGTIPGLSLLSLTGESNVLGDTDTSLLYFCRTYFKNCNISLANAANYIFPNRFLWSKGSLIAPNGSTFLIDPIGGSEILIEDVDLSAIGAGALIKNGAYPSGIIQINRCKLSATGTVGSGSYGTGGYQGKIKLHHCSSANRTWDFNETSNEGVVSPDSAVYRTGGASDGTTPISWKMVSTAAISKFSFPLTTLTINVWNALTSEITLTVHGILDSATNLKKDEVWMEVDYPADASSGLGTMATSQIIYQPATGSPADLTASTETWTESMANPNKFKFAVTFTPGKAGPIAARICVGKPSTTLYICPKAVLT